MAIYVPEEYDATIEQQLNHIVFEKAGDNGEYFVFTEKAGEVMYQSEKSYIDYVPDDKDHFIVPFRFADFEVGKAYHTYLNFGERKTPVKSEPEVTEKETTEASIEESAVTQASTEEQVAEVNKIPLTYYFLAAELVVIVLVGVVVVVTKKKQ